MRSHRTLMLPIMLGIAACCSSLISLLPLSPLESGTTAPDLTLPNTAGIRVSLSNYRDRIVLLNFWTST